ncbi:hypothetical protein GCM10009854_46540 [Saccharopolyspora halophila]|uniref:DUF2795 domain-containing protein n=1 Tax=Saccharopolyspora halophila TaxID=405551 RepID=A0ABN3GW12_9PSEU
MVMVDRAELLRLLSHVRFPATKDEILQQCREQDAGAEHLARLEHLPADVYVEADTVLQAIPHPAP